MYLRTLLYALRQGVALESGEPVSKPPSPSAATAAEAAPGVDASSTGSVASNPDGAAGKVPDRLLDLYLSSEDSISLTSKVLDVYATYVDRGEASLAM